MANFSRNMKLQILGAVILAVLGIILLAVGITYDLRYARYEETTARVVDVDYSKNSDGEWMVSYTYEYEVNGQTFRRKSNSSTSENIAHSIGSTVKIKYDPENPNKIIESVWVGVLFTGIGALFTVLSVVVVIYTVHGHRKSCKIKTADYGNEQIEDLQLDENGNAVIADAEGDKNADGNADGGNDITDVFDI